MKLLDPNCPTALAILLGAFLLTAFCSLRFGDTQRVCISSLSLTSSSLRGTCWTTNTSSTGQPFACTHFGITGRDTATAWTVTWLAHLHDARLETQKCYGPDVEPDFLIPAIEHWEAPGIPVFHCPLQYHQALQLLRWMVQTPWTTSLIKPEEAQSFTMHSLKVSLLSASAQLRLPEESRRLQGHHKTSSTQLYSRDFLTKPAQRYIASFETLAQFALLQCTYRITGHRHLQVRVPSGTDNTATEAGINKLFTTKWPLSHFLKLIASWSHAHGVALQPTHIPGKKNTWADELSRDQLSRFRNRRHERIRFSPARLATGAHSIELQLHPIEARWRDEHRLAAS